MGILRYIDKKFTYKEQKRYIKGFCFWGIAIGYGLGQLITIFALGWVKYKFSIGNLIITAFFDSLICAPFIINIIKHSRRYNYTLEFLKKNKTAEVKCLFNREDYIFDFQINNLYKIELSNSYTNSNISIINTDTWATQRNYKDICNRFELQDLKATRLKKLKKLKRKFF